MVHNAAEREEIGPKLGLGPTMIEPASGAGPSKRSRKAKLKGKRPAQTFIVGSSKNGIIIRELEPNSVESPHKQNGRCSKDTWASAGLLKLLLLNETLVSP